MQKREYSGINLLCRLYAFYLVSDLTREVIRLWKTTLGESPEEADVFNGKTLPNGGRLVKHKPHNQYISKLNQALVNRHVKKILNL